VICGYRVEEIEDELMRNIRYMDKLIDELAKGKKMEKILRTVLNRYLFYGIINLTNLFSISKNFPKLAVCALNIIQ